MGCCYSKNEDPSTSSSQNPSPVPPLMADSDIFRPDPSLPPQPEEETVKEVLSETPTQRKPQPFPKKMEELEKKEQKIPLSPILPSFPKVGTHHHVDILKKKNNNNNNIDNKEVPFPFCVTPPEISEEVSEICSLSLSLSESYSTTTVTERRDEEDDGRSRDYGEVRQRVHNNRSPAKLHRKWSNPGHEFHGVAAAADSREPPRRSPARRSEQPSPGRRNDNAMRSDMGQNGRRTRVAAANNNRSWRDPGESSGRRSRSPSTTRNPSGSANPSLGRSPSARKTGRSPARVPPLTPENNYRRLDESTQTKEEEDETVPANESLENPLVSLECFIFL